MNRHASLRVGPKRVQACLRHHRMSSNNGLLAKRMARLSLRLDAFGAGSMFELLSAFSTRAGEVTLVRWQLECKRWLLHYASEESPLLRAISFEVEQDQSWQGSR